jgi:peptide deformylase
LSIPGQENDSDETQRFLITRPITIEAEYYDSNFKAQTLKVTGLMAKCFQHELDHLNGITLLDHTIEWQKEEL